MLDKDIIEILEEVNSVYKENCWLEVKKYLLKSLSIDKRKKFSKRDYLTKKHSINKYEKIIIEYYKEKYDITLVLKEKDKHTKLFWQRSSNE